MIFKATTQLFLGTMAVALGPGAHAQFEFLNQTLEPLPVVPVPPEQVSEIVARVANDYETTHMDASEIWKAMPLPPDDYPESLQGILWMDQYGSYGYQTISPQQSNESLLTFGNAHVGTLDTENRLIWMAAFCAYWTVDSPYFGDTPALESLNQCDNELTVLSQFVFNEDYTVAELHPYNTTTLVPQDNILGYRAMMALVPPQPEGTCPPADNATKQERNLCAKWIRTSFDPDATDPIPEEFMYPVFEVVNNKGQPVEPYYSAYLEHLANKNATQQYMRKLKAANTTADPEESTSGGVCHYYTIGTLAVVVLASAALF